MPVALVLAGIVLILLALIEHARTYNDKGQIGLILSAGAPRRDRQTGRAQPAWLDHQNHAISSSATPF
jgi:hypothetical protein